MPKVGNARDICRIVRYSDFQYFASSNVTYEHISKMTQGQSNGVLEDTFLLSSVILYSSYFVFVPLFPSIFQVRLFPLILLLCSLAPTTRFPVLPCSPKTLGIPSNIKTLGVRLPNNPWLVDSKSFPPFRKWACQNVITTRFAAKFSTRLTIGYFECFHQIFTLN